ncbi:MAG TPA: peptidoglycan DD-metalloendopeptidase family protein [Candidatus Eisenbergiella merdipullorum]|uniref:Peptidoglycan DD-metalloendopeptidase family protein n=1 Tax=Candidatus Eisenbergiella merdipullorum TaxID=2838553 RepID=A0A9D2L2Q3_9FIRM|nr:peptidoglycan DD-metalloendopeptidase family protein [Candidatus Eisenbergiella merdipullorum]
MRKCRKSTCVLLCFLLLSVWLLPGNISSAATADELEQSIQEKEEAISQAQEQKEQIQANISNIQAMVDELESTKDDLEAYVEQLDGNLAEIQSRINELKGLIEEKETEIEETEKELDEAVAREEAQYEAMKVRIQYSYERGEKNLLEMLLTADSFGELLNRVGYIEQMNTYDQEQLAAYVKNRELVEACRTALAEEREVLEEAKAEVEEEEAGLETLIAEKEAQITAYQSDINNKEAAIADYEADIEIQNSTIAALEAAAAEAKKQLEELNQPQVSYDGGVFQMPLASYKRVSSEYGYRIHPTLGVNKFHNGVDFAANAGTPIMAAYDGTVVGASYNSSMGNYVMIDHGDGLYTIYMHASELYVSSGQTVSKGETIAAVGSTGRSTGPHLHFSVRLNGEYVNPWNYLS